MLHHIWCKGPTQLVQTDEHSKILKVIEQVEEPKHTPTDILNFIPISIGYLINLSFWGILHSTDFKEIL